MFFVPYSFIMAPALHANETTSASPFSPGLVGNGEILIREVCDPKHLNPDGKISAAAIMTKELREDGLSVHRRQHTTSEFVKEQIQKRCSNPPDRVGFWKEWVAVFRTGDVRSILDESKKQALVVVDTAKMDHTCHASIYVADPPNTKGYAKKIKPFLLSLLELHHSVDAAFQEKATTSNTPE